MSNERSKATVTASTGVHGRNCVNLSAHTRSAADSRKQRRSHRRCKLGSLLAPAGKVRLMSAPPHGADRWCAIEHPLAKRLRRAVLPACLSAARRNGASEVELCCSSSSAAGAGATAISKPNAMSSGAQTECEGRGIRFVPWIRVFIVAFCYLLVCEHGCKRLLFSASSVN